MQSLNCPGLRRPPALASSSSSRPAPPRQCASGSGLGRSNSARSSCVQPCPARSAPPRRDARRVAAAAAGGPDEPAPVATSSLDERIASGEFTDVGSTKEKMTRPVRKFLAQDPVGVGRLLALLLARLGREWRAAAAARMPEARGDIREIVGQPVFVPLYNLYLTYGKIFRLSFGPKRFVIISDPGYVKQILATNAANYSKGLLSEILDFVMGSGLIPADGEVWRVRRRAIVPALHKRYVASMVSMFGACAAHGADGPLAAAAAADEAIEMESFFSRLGLDIIGKAVFNYDFDSLTHDDPVIQAVYTALREAEYRSTAFIPYWNFPPARWIVPRQRRCEEALKVINATLDGLVAKCKALVESEDAEFGEEFLSEDDPSILHFLLASGDEISSKQLRDDLMTLLIAGHETTAAVLTWTLHLLGQHPDVAARIRAEVDEVLGDAAPDVDSLRRLGFTTRVIAESMRLYPQPPVLIRRALADDTFDDYLVPAGSDIFISVWNLHRSPQLWPEPNSFNPDRFPLDQPPPNEVTHDYAYLPFGGGRRKCIGDQFALLEALATLAVLMRRYEFEPAPDKPGVGMTTGATIHTVAGLWMNVRRRTPPPAAAQSDSAALPSAPLLPPLAPQPVPVGAAFTAGSDSASGDSSSSSSSSSSSTGSPAAKCPFSGALGALTSGAQAAAAAASSAASGDTAPAL